MKKTLRQSIAGYEMPRYMTEILTRHYGSGFLRMSIIRERDAYMFSYETGRLRRLKYAKLNTEKRLRLIRTLCDLNEENEEMLIPAEQYLLEPELVYSAADGVMPGEVKLLFYPDMTAMPFERKLLRFIEKIQNKQDTSERELFAQIAQELESGDRLRLIRLLDKLLRRREAEAEEKRTLLDTKKTFC